MLYFHYDEVFPTQWRSYFPALSDASALTSASEEPGQVSPPASTAVVDDVVPQASQHQSVSQSKPQFPPPKPIDQVAPLEPPLEDQSGPEQSSPSKPPSSSQTLAPQPQASEAEEEQLLPSQDGPQQPSPPQPTTPEQPQPRQTGHKEFDREAFFASRLPKEKEDPASLTACPVGKFGDPDDQLKKWVLEKASMVKAGKCGRVVIADPNFCAPGAGVGNCILGVMSTFALAIIVDGIPLLGSSLQHTALAGMSFTNGTWTTSAARCRAKGPQWGFGQMGKGSGSLPGFSELMSADLKGGFRSGTTIQSPQYVAAAMLINNHVRQRACQFFPGIFQGSRANFGFFHRTFHSFFTIPESQAVRDVVKHGWRVQGPFLALHVRRAFRTLPWFEGCLEQLIHQLKLETARIFIATTWKEVRNSFTRKYGIKDGFLVNDSRGLYPPRAYEIRFTAALEEKGSGGKNWKDRKSPSAMTDFHILSQAEILVGEPRSTFSDGAAAIGNPYLHFIVKEEVPPNDQPGCQEVLFREPCMHNFKHLYQNKAMRPRVKEYLSYCDAKGAGM